MARYIPDEITDAREAGLLGARRQLVQGREHRLRAPPAARTPTRASTSTSTATPCSALVDDHLEGRENRRLLIWSLLNFEQWCEAYL